MGLFRLLWLNFAVRYLPHREYRFDDKTMEIDRTPIWHWYPAERLWRWLTRNEISS